VSRRALLVVLALVPALSACGDEMQPSGPPGGSHAPPGDSIAQLDVAFCRALAPRWVAFQDGDGPWTSAQPVDEGRRVRFHHGFSAKHGAVATVSLLPAGMTALSIQYGAVAELAAVGDTTSTGCAEGGFVTVLGNVAKLDAGELAVVTTGFASQEVFGPAPGPLELSLPSSPQDIIATRARVARDSVVVTGFILRRGVAVVDGATLPVFDFDASEAFQPTIRTLTITGRGNDHVVAAMGVRTANTQSALLAFQPDSTTVTQPYYAIPTSGLVSSDVQFLAARAMSTTPGAVRRATMYFHSPADVTLPFAAEVAPPEVSVAASAPTLRPRARFARQADYDRLTTITYRADGTVVSVAMTDAYATLSGNGYDLVVPELGGVPGFDVSWALRPASGVNWSVVRIGGTLGLGPDAVPTDGAIQRAAELSGTTPAAR
jgi:hypothetical protein